MPTWSSHPPRRRLSPEFTSGDLVDGPGHTFEQVFADPGVFKYYCSPHKSMGMKGAVVTPK